MGKIAFLCPGYGSEFVGMGVDFVGRYKWGADFFEDAKATCGLDIFDMCSNGPAAELSQTQNAQPSLVVTAIAIARALRERGIEPSAAAGIGEGEYAAHVIAGTIDVDSALELVARRGALMAMAAHVNKGAAVELEGCTLEQVTEIIDECNGTEGTALSASAQLSPVRAMVSGSTDAVDALASRWTDKGRKARVYSGQVPANCKLMRSAATGMHMALKNTLFGPGEIPVYDNLEGERFDHMRSPELLGDEIVSPILWRQSIEAMIRDGVDTFVQCGPGSTALDAAKETAEALGAQASFIKVATAEDVMFTKF